jgi:hypothetical protein
MHRRFHPHMDSHEAWKGTICQRHLARDDHAYRKYPSRASSVGKCKVPQNHTSESNRLLDIQSRTELNALFPELTKSVTGLSWKKFDVPTLFLEHPNSDDAWRGDNTLEIAR